MHVVDDLLRTAVEDSRLLVKNKELGDRPELSRDIDFVLYAKSEERAELVKSLIIDNQYGEPSVSKIEHEEKTRWRLLVVIQSPATENIVHALSGFMICLAHLYDLDYDGWGCVIQR